MAAEDFDVVVANAGTGGANFAMDTFADLSGDTRVMPFSCLVVPDGVGYSRVGASNPLPVTGPLTDTQIRATPLPISAAALPLPTGAASAANQAMEIAGLASIDGHVNGIQGLLTSIDGHVITCNTGAVVLAAGSAVIGHVIVDGCALPTGAATAALQTTGNISLTSLDSKTPTPSTISGENIAAPSAPAAYSFGMIFDGTNWDRMPGTSAGGVLVNLGSNNGVDTELPAAAILADATANPTAPAVGSCLLLFNGTTWDRLRGDTANGVDVDVTRMAALVAGSAIIGKVTTDQTTHGTTDLVAADVTKFAGTAVDVNSGNKGNGTQRVVLATDQPAFTTPLPTNDVPATSGGCSTYSFLSTASVQAAAIKASPGQVYGIEMFNSNAAARYVRLYNQTGSPANTDNANIIWRGWIPGNTAVGGFARSFPGGIAFSSGIGIRVTAAVADTDNTSLGANEVSGNVEFK